MGFIFKCKNETIMLIHIPKNSGSYLRKKISSDKNVEQIKSYWGIKDCGYID